MGTFEAAIRDRPSHLATTDVKFQKILLAIDFSLQTAQVIQAAVQIAKVYASELFLVYAAVPPVYGAGAQPTPIETFEVDLEIEQARMAELVKHDPAIGSLPHQEIIAYAPPVELIHKVVEEKNIDLVIAGSHGASGMERLALGSVAECILRTVRCPVLVVGPHAAMPKGLFDSILLATALSTSGLRSAQYASALAEHFHSKLTLLHVVEKRANKPVQPELLEDQLIAKLQELIPQDFAVHATAVPRVEYGEAGDLIVSLALCTRSTLIVAGAQDDKALSDRVPWSTLGEVIRRSPCPVLCVRGHFN